MWVLGTKLKSSAKAELLLTIDPSFLPQESLSLTDLHINNEFASNAPLASVAQLIL